MRRSILALLALLACHAVAAAHIDSYDVNLRLDPSGRAAGSATIVVDGVPPLALEVPLGFDASNVRLLGPAGAGLTTEKYNGQTHLHLTLPAAARTRVDVAFDVAEAMTLPPAPAGQRGAASGNRIFRHALVNTEPATISVYRCVVVFPAEMRAQAIREALPKAGRKEALPRAQLIAVDGGAGARLQVPQLMQGDSASIQIELVPRRHGPWWLLAGLVLSALYLYYFRDLVSAPPQGGPGARLPQSGE